MGVLDKQTCRQLVDQLTYWAVLKITYGPSLRDPLPHTQIYSARFKLSTVCPCSKQQLTPRRLCQRRAPTLPMHLAKEDSTNAPYAKKIIPMRPKPRRFYFLHKIIPMHPKPRSEPKPSSSELRSSCALWSPPHPSSGNASTLGTSPSQLPCQSSASLLSTCCPWGRAGDCLF